LPSTIPCLSPRNLFFQDVERNWRGEKRQKVTDSRVAARQQEAFRKAVDRLRSRRVVGRRNESGARPPWK
jgi:hypothetical protein